MRRDGPSDKTIVRRARQGDRAAFLSLIQRYDPRLRRLALQLLADPLRLDRVLNRAYLKAWRSLPFLKRGEPAAKWLYRIVYNTCLNEMRWEPSRTPPPPPGGERVPLPATPPERRLLALRALGPDERLPLVLVDGEGFGVEDAARLINRPADEVADDLTRARGRWRAFVMGEPEPPPPPERKKAPVPPLEESDGYEPWPVTLPVQLTTRTTLASLGTPQPQREPGGHVKVLADQDVELVAQPPAADRRSARQPHDLEADVPAARNRGNGGNGTKPAARPPAAETETPDQVRGQNGAAAAGTRKGRNGANGGNGKKPAAGNGADTEPSGVRPAVGNGAGARRKRRRDAKRAGTGTNPRSRERSGGMKPPAGRAVPGDPTPDHDTP